MDRGTETFWEKGEIPVKEEVAVASRMTRESLLRWKENWRVVNAREVEELRAMTPDEKFRQLESLMASVDAFGWREQLEEGVEEVRERWHRIRSHSRRGNR